MTDLVLLVPSRGRPDKVARLIDACERTCTADTRLHFGFDNDDPVLSANIMAAGSSAWVTTGTRKGLGGWTNRLAAEHPWVPWLGSIGDDMVPVTRGWDERLIAACGPSGMAYPRDNRRDDIPEIIVMTRDIPAALGWVCLPALHHWYVDNVWSDLGRAAGCLAYLPDVLVEHRHPNVPGGDKPDGTYNDAAQRYAHDLAAYQRWRLRGMAEDIRTVRRIHAAAGNPLRHARSPG